MTRACVSPRAAAALVWKLLLISMLGFTSLAVQAYAGPGALHAKYEQLREQLRHNNFQREMYVDSAEQGDALKGDVYAVLDHPFEMVSKAMQRPADWCDILLLPFNTLQCRAVGGNGGATLQVRIGRKYDQPVQDAYRLQFELHPVAATPEYLESRLDAANGPLGTRDYRIVVAAVPLDAKRTFMHLSYSYVYGMAGRLAMQGYLATAGADKVGFTVTGRDQAGHPTYIGGMRGAIERTAMRYYLAIDAQLASLSAPPDQRLERRLDHWFAASERYPRQLHEMDRGRYLALKRSEFGRPQAKAD